MRKEEELLLSRTLDCRERALREGFWATRFLTPEEGNLLLRRFARDSEAEFLLLGGFPQAERCRGAFRERHWGSLPEEGLLGVLKIQVRGPETLSHPALLGSLLGLGVSREVLGDLQVREKEATAICLPEMIPFFCQSLERVGRATVAVSPGTLEDLEEGGEERLEERLTLSSLRLDALLAKAFHLSRSQAQEAIRQGQVLVNHQVAEKEDLFLREGDLLSYRRHGRIRILKVEERNRRDRLPVSILRN